ncbi:MAG TPA: fructose-1,6-bisphosphate aldolase/phosphatase [Phycisphaerae bacterium]|nr:fructose-1,6-bisphosphate aldolase/phosphatase [Phycisphaerae bacterium]
MAKITLSVIKADVGGYVGHSSIHPRLMEEAEKRLTRAREKGPLIDFRVMHCGDDLELIMTHELGVMNENIHKLAWDTFVAATKVATDLKLYGAGQDLLSDTFSGNVKGLGPGIAEMEFEERKSEPVIIFMADKTSPGAWNLPFYKIFADPFNTVGLVIDPALHEGFKFRILDVRENTALTFECPEELYDMLVFIGSPSRYVVKAVHRKKDDEIAAVASVERLGYMAGRYVGKDDPVMIVRSQSGFPAVGEVLEAFALPHLVEGWMRGSHNGPLMPVGFEHAHPTRFDGPPRVIAAGFQISNGKFFGPRDMFKDVSFDETRRLANFIGDYMRRIGPFEPHRLPLDEMEYTTLPLVMEKMQGRFEPLEEKQD